jgi:hypothetical protein
VRKTVDFIHRYGSYLVNCGKCLDKSGKVGKISGLNIVKTTGLEPVGLYLHE